MLKGDVVRNPGEFFENLGENVRLIRLLSSSYISLSRALTKSFFTQLDSPSFCLSEHGDAYDLAFSKKIQWGAFSGHGASHISLPLYIISIDVLLPLQTLHPSAPSLPLLSTLAPRSKHNPHPSPPSNSSSSPLGAASSTPSSCAFPLLRL